MNNDYQSIIKLFEKNGIENFSRLPDNQGDIKLFADLFNNISNNYYRSIPQLFTWTKRTYITSTFAPDTGCPSVSVTVTVALAVGA